MLPRMAVYGEDLKHKGMRHNQLKCKLKSCLLLALSTFCILQDVYVISYTSVICGFWQLIR